jgi:hypothetical protein
MHAWNFGPSHILWILAFIFALIGLLFSWRTVPSPAPVSAMPWWEISWLFFLAGMIWGA